MGAARNDMVTNFTSGIVSPFIGLVFKSLKYILKKGTVNELEVVVGESAIIWGEL